MNKTTNRQKIILGTVIISGLAIDGVLAYRKLKKKK
jgi:hypothetical protein